jgi:endonuclease-3
MINYPQVFKVFRENYKEVPLETFGRDPYKSLISTLMSARTNDDTTLAAAKRLFKSAPDMESLKKLSEIKIQRLIFPVGFYKTKAKHIKLLAKIIINEYRGKIPSTREELVKLPGVGRKTANLVLNRAFRKPAIAVDTHVHRITNILGWVKTSNPPKTELELIKIVPKKYWPEMNKLFVSIGRQYRSKKQLTEFLKKNKLI